MALKGDQCRAARALLNMSQAELAKRANLKTNTLAPFENGIRKLRPASAQNIRGVLVVEGIMFIDDEDGIGVKRRRTLNELEEWQASEAIRKAKELKALQPQKKAQPKITPDQCRGARAIINLSQRELAAMAQVSIGSVVSFENGRVIPLSKTLKKLEAVFRSHGLEFTYGETPSICILSAPAKVEEGA